MSHNAYILKKLEADRYLASVLEKSISEIGKQSLKQAGLLYDGTERLTWFLSCLTENYYDVCQKMSIEDMRFLKAIYKLVDSCLITYKFTQRVALAALTSNYTHSYIAFADEFKYPDVIRSMFEEYIDIILFSLPEIRVSNILRNLTKYGAGFYSSGMTNRAVAYSIVTAICMSSGVKMSINSVLTKVTKWGPILVGSYGYIKLAANAADRLKNINPLFYNKLYDMGIEMLYFLIEPIIIKIENKYRESLSDEAVAADILRLIE